MADNFKDERSDLKTKDTAVENKSKKKKNKKNAEINDTKNKSQKYHEYFIHLISLDYSFVILLLSTLSYVL